jgi:hypothetical protein
VGPEPWACWQATKEGKGEMMDTKQQIDQRVPQQELVRVQVRGFDIPSIRATVIDFDMPFGSMVTFMVKWALASIPAIIILGIIAFFVIAFLSAVVRPH